MSKTLIFTFVSCLSPFFIQAQLFSGPGYKATIYTIPEKILTKVNTVAVLPFDGINTYYNHDLKFGTQLADILTQALQEEMRGASGSTARIFMTKLPTNIYKMVDRTEVERIIKQEQVKSTGGEIDQNSVVRLGNLMSAQAFVTGTFIIEPKPVAHSNYTVKNVTTYTSTREVIFKVTMRITKVETGEPIVLTFEEKESSSASSTSGYPNESTLETIDNLAFKAIKEIAPRMGNSFSPYYSTINVALEKSKIKDQKDQFKEAFEQLDNGDLSNGCSTFMALYQQDEYNAELNFNIGSVHFGVGNFKQAAGWYEKAFKLSNQSEKSYQKWAQTANAYAENIAWIQTKGWAFPSIEICENVSNPSDALKSIYIVGTEKVPAIIYEKMGPGNPPKMIRTKMKVKVLGLKDDWYEVEMPTGDRRFVEKNYTSEK